MHPSIPSALKLIPLSGFTHSTVSSALMTAWAFEYNLQRLIIQYGKNVDLFLVSKLNIAQKLKNPQFMGFRVDLI